jgi:GH25 family lysozyme M1 (1,4-beta-N-acetylmuramidase)
MAKFGIDISNWQGGLNLAGVPFDFAIFKACESTSFVDREFKGWADWCMANGRRFGAYAFARDESYASFEAQARYFVDVVRPYLGHCTLWLDWENTSYSSVQSAGPWGAKRFIDEVRRLSGHDCGIYMSYSVSREWDWSCCSDDGVKLWGAGYPTMADRWGYQTPSRWDGWGSWGLCDIRQYSSTTYLDGYGGHLDVNCLWGDSMAWWDEMAGGEPPKPQPIGKLEVDGWLGPLSVGRLQAVLGSPYQDRVISGQYRPNKQYYPRLDAVEFDGGSGDSWAVKKLQGLLGVEQDGVIGKITVTAWQRHVIGLGYSCGPDGADGYLGEQTAKAIQRALNDDVV